LVETLSNGQVEILFNLLAIPQVEDVLRPWYVFFFIGNRKTELVEGLLSLLHLVEMPEEGVQSRAGDCGLHALAHL
jgi:hypothetical protein